MGEAQILTTIDGTQPRLYDVTIERVNMTANDPNRNLLIRVTDPELLSATGGIVQGMSGSPVIQNGCLVGAVTMCWSMIHKGLRYFCGEYAQDGGCAGNGLIFGQR